MLFLLKDGQGHALMIANAASQAEADAFGRNQLPEFCGESVEIDAASQNEAEEFWGVRTVRVLNVLVDGSHSVTTVAEPAPRSRPGRSPLAILSRIVIHGLELPGELDEDDCLTPEDRKEIALDHIFRTSQVIAKIEICKRT